MTLNHIHKIHFYFNLKSLSNGHPISTDTLLVLIVQSLYAIMGFDYAEELL